MLRGFLLLQQSSSLFASITGTLGYISLTEGLDDSYGKVNSGVF